MAQANPADAILPAALLVMTNAAAAVPARSPWFRSAPFDLLLILGVPFVTWPLLMLLQDATGAERLNQLILITATGHYFATFVRTYGDRELFARFRTRFVVAPLVLLVVCVGMFASGHGAPLLLVTAGWAFWHWLAQAFGFARIYDSKVGSFRPLTAWLDKAIVIAGFVGAVVLNAGSTATFGKAFLEAGVPLPSASTYALIQQCALAAMAAVALAYTANLGWTIARGLPWSWQKQFMHVTTIGYYWFAFAYLPNVLVAYVLYELFHDVQYYAITWLTCRSRTTRPNVTNWLARMFQPRWSSALGFVIAMSVFGGLDAFGRARLTADSLPYQIWLGVVLTAALLHYYYDGFVWKARESALGADLGIQSGLRAAVVPQLGHAALWSLFFVPLGALLVAGRPAIVGRERAEALVAVAPDDFVAQAELGMELTRARDLPAALAHYRASLAANPDFAQARVNYGAALDLQGDYDAAREQYEAALQKRDHSGAHATANINLGVLELLRGDRAAADRHFAAGAQLGGGHPIGRLLGMAAGIPADAIDRRAAYYAAALQLDPGVPEAHLGLGTLAVDRRQWRDAVAHLGAFVQRVGNHVPALLGLAKAQLELGQTAGVRAMLERVLQIEPGNLQALTLQSRLGGQ